MAGALLKQRYCLNTNTVLYTPTVGEKRPAEFPSSWFRDHPLTKRIINVPLCSNLQSLRKKIRAAIDGKALSVDYVVSYLFEVLKNIKEKSIVDITSYQLELAKTNDEINPFFSVSINPTAEPTADAEESSSEPTAADDKWMTLWILSLYRLERASDPAYREQLIKNLTDHIKLAGYTSSCGFHQALIHNSNWVNNSDFRKVVACVDWFFFINDRHQWSSIRMATIGSRYRDCAALTSLSHITKILGLKDIADFIDWTSNYTISLEMSSMLCQEEEDGVINSYFPYQVDFGLVSRSAFSARMNPAIHTYCHILGAMFGNLRSLNARFFLEEDLPGVIFNAQWVGCVFLTSIKQQRAFIPVEGSLQQTQERVRLARAALAEGDQEMDQDYDGTSEPMTTDINEWFNFMEGNQWQLTRKMKLKIRACSRDIRSPRPRTIAELLTKAIFYGDEETTE